MRHELPHFQSMQVRLALGVNTSATLRAATSVFRILVWWLVLLPLGCGNEVRVCPAESTEVKQGEIRRHQERSLVDPTSRGRLSGNPTTRGARAIVLLD